MGQMWEKEKQCWQRRRRWACALLLVVWYGLTKRWLVCSPPQIRSGRTGRHKCNNILVLGIFVITFLNVVLAIVLGVEDARRHRRAGLGQREMSEKTMGGCRGRVMNHDAQITYLVGMFPACPERSCAPLSVLRPLHCRHM